MLPSQIGLFTNLNTRPNRKLCSNTMLSYHQSLKLKLLSGSNYVYQANKQPTLLSTFEFWRLLFIVFFYSTCASLYLIPSYVILACNSYLDSLSNDLGFRINDNQTKLIYKKSYEKAYHV